MSRYPEFIMKELNTMIKHIKDNKSPCMDLVYKSNLLTFLNDEKETMQSISSELIDLIVERMEEPDFLETIGWDMFRPLYQYYSNKQIEDCEICFTYEGLCPFDFAAGEEEK